MPDEPKEESSFSISVPDLVRLKHRLNQSITWGNSNLNALEVENLTRLTAEDYARIRKDYRQWNVNMVSNVVLLLFTLGCVVACIYFSNGWLKGVAVGIGILCLYEVAKREGHAEGYIDGYSAGHEEGVHKTLGVKPDQLEKMNESANEIRIDSMVIERLDEREKKS